MNFQRLAITATLLLAVVASVAVTVLVSNHNDPTPTPQPTPVVIQDDAAAAKIVLKAPEKAKVGQLVVLDVSESTAKTFRWEPQQKTSNFLVIDNGKRAVFSAEAPGDYTFVIAAANADAVDVKIHVIKIAGTAVEVTDGMNQKVAKWCEKIDYPAKRDDLLKLAQSFSSVSALINDQMSPGDIVEATKKSNRDALGANIQNWVPFLEGLQGELESQAKSGKLPDNESHRRMWRAIADGLKEYAGTL